jgi:hypothetical protein
LFILSKLGAALTQMGHSNLDPSGLMAMLKPS